LLITECSFRVGESWGEKPVHLNPKTAAKVAKQANVKKLALTHFDASRYKTLQEREAAQIQAQKIFKNTICAIDGMEIEI
jgi:ribonuclease BN (tRNA processing enzyme)